MHSSNSEPRRLLIVNRLRQRVTDACDSIDRSDDDDDAPCVRVSHRRRLHGSDGILLCRRSTQPKGTVKITNAS